MASSSKFFTIGGMEKVQVDSVTSEASGHEIEFGLDHNLDTYYKGSSTASQQIVLDLQEAKQIDGIFLWCHNYDTDHKGSSARFAVHVGDGDEGTPASFDVLVHDVTLESLQTVGEPLLHLDFGTSATKRYWRFWMSGTYDTYLETSMMFMYRERIVNIGNAWPETEIDTYHNQSFKAQGGRTFVARQSRQRTTTIPRRWIISGTADFNALQNAFRDSSGAAFPLIFNEDSEYRAVRFQSSAMRQLQSDYLLYDVNLVMDQLSYIEDGETY